MTQEEQSRTPPSRQRYYSNTAERRRWPPTGRQVLATIAIVIALVSLSLIGYFFGWGWGLGGGQALWIIGLVVIFLMAVTTLTFVSLWEWLGFGRGGEKTGLDLLQFVVTASIPIIVALGGILFTIDQNANREVVEEERAQDEELRAYLEEMRTLLLEGELVSQQQPEVRTVAQARTSYTLSRLNTRRKMSVVRFLYDSNLIEADEPTIGLSDVGLSDANLSSISLRGANLSSIDLSGADLSGATLTDAHLMGAKLSKTNLSDAHLNGAILNGAILSGADLRDAKGVTNEKLEQAASSLAGATMPDGSKHD